MDQAATDPAEAKTCGACGVPLVGPYCHACGQQNEPQRLPLKDLLRNVLAESFNLEGRTFRTADAMLRRPGQLLVAYREGWGYLYTTPFKLFLIVSAVFFVFLVWSDVAIYQFLPVATGGPISAELVPGGVRLIGAGFADVFLFPKAGPEVTAQAIGALEAARVGADEIQLQAISDFIQYQMAWTDLNAVLEIWLPRLLRLLLPIYALMLWPLFKPGCRMMVEHLVFSLWAHCLIFILLVLFATLNWMGLRLSFWLLAVPYLIYFTLAARRYYEMGTWSAAWRGAVHIMAFFCLAWVPISLTLAWTSAWEDLPSSFWIAETSEGLTDIDRWVLPSGTDQAKQAAGIGSGQ